MTAQIIKFPQRPRAAVAQAADPLLPFVLYGLMVLAFWELWRR